MSTQNNLGWINMCVQRAGEFFQHACMNTLFRMFNEHQRGSIDYQRNDCMKKPSSAEGQVRIREVLGISSSQQATKSEANVMICLRLFPGFLLAGTVWNIELANMYFFNQLQFVSTKKSCDLLKCFFVMMEGVQQPHNHRIFVISSCLNVAHPLSILLVWDQISRINPPWFIRFFKRI